MNKGTSKPDPVRNPAPQGPKDAAKDALHDALASVLDAVVVVDSSGRLVSANDRATDITGKTLDDLKGVALSELVPEFETHVTHPQQFREQVLALGRGGLLASELTFPLTGSAGNLRVYSTEVVQVETPRKPQGETVRTEEEELEYLKKEFISTISHELRTPLTAIKGAVGLALGGAAGPVSPSLRELLELAEKNTDRLISLINDILDMFRLETRRLPLRTEPLSIEESIQHQITRHWEAAEKGGVKLEVNAEPGLPPVMADRVRLEQALENLLSNAIKFSPNGQVVTVGARLVNESGLRFVEISVQDHGKGIAPEAQKRIFSKFAQAEDTLTREHQGSGLGLAITHGIVDLHGGRIWFESTPGKGSTFYFTMPVATTAQNERSGARTTPDASERASTAVVLVVDDDSDVARIVCGIFNANGYRAYAVERGDEVVEWAQRHRPALIALDLFMPGMSGFEVLHQLKQNQQTRTIPVICMSVVDDSGRALAMGAEKFVSKPIDSQTLVEIAGSVLRSQRGDVASDGTT